jgi:hypothetical protein
VLAARPVLISREFAVEGARAKSRGDKTVQSTSGGEKNWESSHRGLPYSAEEDALLWDLVKQGFNWEEIDKRFGRRFGGRSYI